MTQSADNLIWIDLEMTGLNPDGDYIIEIATIVTDPQLNVLAEGPVMAIHQDDAVLAAMDEWNTRQHGKSGLTRRVRESSVTEAEAEAQTIALLSQYVPANSSPMCGNSVCQDRRFLYRHMPALGAGGDPAVHQAVQPPGAGGHTRFHRRTETLPAACVQDLTP